MTTTTATYKGREVRNPALRALILGGMFLVLVMLFLLGVMSLPLHFALRAAGRRGFVNWSADHSSFTYDMDKRGFGRAAR